MKNQNIYNRPYRIKLFCTITLVLLFSISNAQEKLAIITSANNGTRLNQGWLLNSNDQILGIGDFNNDRRSDFIIKSGTHLGIVSTNTNSKLITIAAIQNENRFGNRWSLKAKDKIIGVGDFNEDGRSDFIIKSDTHLGIIGLNAQGKFVTLAFLANESRFGTAWKLQNKDKVIAVGDFNKDGRSDFIIKSDTHLGIVGLNAQGKFVTLSILANGSRFGSGWKFQYKDEILGIGDFNKDGRSNFIIKSSTHIGIVGLNAKGKFVTLASLANGSRFGSGWKFQYKDEILGIGDFNKDGRSDFIIKSGTHLGIVGLNAEKRFTTIITLANESRFGTGWRFQAKDEVLGIGDFNKDGRSDFIIKSKTHRGIVGLDDGGNFTSITILNNDVSLGNEWYLDNSDKILGIADFNKNGRSDFIIRNSTSLGIVGLGLPDNKTRNFTKMIKLPMHKKAQKITYRLEDGIAIFEGDIILGEGHDFTIEEPEPHPTPRSFTEFGTIGAEKYGVVSSALSVRQSAGIIDRMWTWKNGVIPYKIGPWFSDAEKAIIYDAILELNNSTNLNIVSSWDTGQKRIAFKKRNGIEAQGNSRVGRNRVLRHRIRLRSGFDKVTVMHELLHAAGMWHEQSRRDRDRFVQINYQNMDSENWSQFDIHDLDAEIITPYDVNSIMHYHGLAWNNNGLPTIIDLSTGAPIIQASALSRYDIDGINTVYPIDYYNSDMSRSPTFARTVKLEVLQVVSRDLDGPGDENEFYIKTEIGAGFEWRPNNSINSTRKQISDKVRTSSLQATPNWVHSHLIDPNETYAKVWLQLREDDGLAGNERKDDTFNINPLPALNELELKIDTMNGQIYLGNIDGVFTGADYIGDLGDTIQLEGFQGEFKAYIVFRITLE